MPTAKVKALRAPVKKPLARSTWARIRKDCPRGFHPVAAYYRMSSDQQDKSIDAQRDSVEKWAATQKFCILWEYVDNGISGDATAKRKAFQQMRDDAVGGDFDTIVCWDQDRFGRFDSLEGGWWTHPLREAGVRLVTVAQGVIDWNNYIGRMTYSLMQEGKHQYLVDHSRNVTRGLAAKAQRGEWHGGLTPMGYVLNAETQKLELGDPDEISIVLKMFDWYDRGVSLRSIVDRLNKDGRNPRTGRHWCHNTVRSILTKPHVTGDYVWPLTSQGKYHCVRDGAVTHDVGETGERIFIADNHPKIVDRDLFDRVAARLTANRKLTTPIKSGGGFYLTGILFCAHCGSPMRGRTQTIKGNSNVYYMCSGHQRRGKSFCGFNNVRQDVLMAEVMTHLEEWATSPDTLNGFDEKLRKLIAQSSDTANVENLRRRLDEIAKLLATAEKRILTVDDELMPIIQRQIKELLAERRDVTEQLAVADVPTETAVDSHSRRFTAALAAIGDVRRLIAERDPAAVRALLGDVIERIDVRFETRQSKGKKLFYDLIGGQITMRRQIVTLVNVA